MDTPDIPVLTEVYKSKPEKTIRDKELLPSEMVAAIVDELREEITAQLKEELNQRLKQELIAKIAEQLNNETAINLRKDIHTALSSMEQQQASALAKLDQATESIRQAEQSQREQATALLTLHKQELDGLLHSMHETYQQKLNADLQDRLTTLQSHFVENAVAEATAQFTTSQLKISEEWLAETSPKLETIRSSALQGMLTEASAELAQMQETWLANATTKSTEILNHTQMGLNQFTEQMHQWHEDKLKEIQESTIAQLQQQVQTLSETLQKTVSENLDQQRLSFEEAMTASVDQLNQQLNNDSEHKQKEFETTLNSMVDGLHAQTREELEVNVKQQMQLFIQDTLEKKKQTTVEELNRFYQEHTQQTQDNFEHRTHILAEEMKVSVKNYAESMMLETNEAISAACRAQIDQAKTDAMTQMELACATLIESQRALFREAIAGDRPELEQILSERLGKLLGAELPVFEEGMMIKVRSAVFEALQSVKLILPER